MTETSGFGVSGRQSHDSKRFYARFAKVQETKDNTTFDCPVRDQIIVGSSANMVDLPDTSIAMVVTSPPYHVGKDYDTDVTIEEYFDEMRAIVRECARVLQPGGRMAVNVANLGRRPYIDLRGGWSDIMVEAGLFPRGEIIWLKGDGASGSCAWGTWMSAKSPVLRDLHEYILVFSKGRYDRCLNGESTMSGEEFMDLTLSVWRFRPESAKRVGHPAPFPVELPRRLIQLYTYAGETVLDPFMGSGTTALACMEQGRSYVGYELHEPYAQLAEERIEDWKQQQPPQLPFE